MNWKNRYDIGQPLNKVSAKVGDIVYYKDNSNKYGRITDITGLDTATKIWCSMWTHHINNIDKYPTISQTFSYAHNCYLYKRKEEE